MEQISKAQIKNYTTYKLAGTVNKIYFPLNVLELKSLINNLKKKKIKYKILGNGSNLIIRSSYDGVLIKLKNFDKLIIDGNIVRVESGYLLSKLALKCASSGLSGLEFAASIPATVGGAIYQNAGAYGKKMEDVVLEVLALDECGNLIKFKQNDLNFGYRDSIFKHKNLVILEAVLKLSEKDSENILDEIKKNMETRKEKQPLDFPSAGSVFKNPFGESAGRLIEKVGLKGYHVGDAMVSLKHANFILNVGKASGDDVIKLIKIIQNKVKEETGISLELEQEILE